MTYLFLKILYHLYFLGIALFVLNSLSKVIFRRMRFSRRLHLLVASVIFSVLWPLSLLSAEGRKVILLRANNF